MTLSDYHRTVNSRKQKAGPRGASPRARETSRVVWLWLSRLETVLDPAERKYLADCLRAAGLEASAEAERPLLDFSHLYRVMARLRRRCPDAMLRLVNALVLTDLGLLGHALISAESIGDALAIELRYTGLTTERMRTELELGDRLARYAITPLPGFETSLEEIGEDAIGGYWRLLGLLLGPKRRRALSRARAAFPYPAPGHADSYRAVFGRSCEFDAPQMTLSFPIDWLDYRLSVSHPDAAAIGKAVQDLLADIDSPGSEFAHSVRSLLLDLAGRSVPRLEEAAAAMRMSATQLRKRLYRDGTTYKQVVLETRMTLARHYLRATALPIQDIAYILDYSQPAPFARAFRRYHDVTPQRFREQSH